MKWTPKKITGVSIIIVFSIFFVVSFIMYPDFGEKILYGKHPPNKEPDLLTYSEIVESKNYQCMETASLRAGGDFSNFLKEFNECEN